MLRFGDPYVDNRAGRRGQAGGVPWTADARMAVIAAGARPDATNRTGVR
jgi:hypothetical protein